jgi:hypothetical protein
MPEKIVNIKKKKPATIAAKLNRTEHVNVSQVGRENDVIDVKMGMSATNANITRLRVMATERLKKTESVYAKKAGRVKHATNVQKDMQDAPVNTATCRPVIKKVSPTTMARASVSTDGRGDIAPYVNRV